MLDLNPVHHVLDLSKIWKQLGRLFTVAVLSLAGLSANSQSIPQGTNNQNSERKQLPNIANKENSLHRISYETLFSLKNLITIGPNVYELVGAVTLYGVYVINNNNNTIFIATTNGTAISIHGTRLVWHDLGDASVIKSAVNGSNIALILRNQKKVNSVLAITPSRSWSVSIPTEYQQYLQNGRVLVCSRTGNVLIFFMTQNTFNGLLVDSNGFHVTRVQLEVPENYVLGKPNFENEIVQIDLWHRHNLEPTGHSLILNLSDGNYVVGQPSVVQNGAQINSALTVSAGEELCVTISAPSSSPINLTDSQQIPNSITVNSPISPSQFWVPPVNNRTEEFYVVLIKQNDSAQILRFKRRNPSDLRELYFINQFIETVTNTVDQARDIVDAEKPEQERFTGRTKDDYENIVEITMGLISGSDFGKNILSTQSEINDGSATITFKVQIGNSNFEVSVKVVNWSGTRWNVQKL
ncbi:MAG: hypothetical protein NZO16_02185 [Deltaproteobacteria bacterium]|nr:hypothetical protein [Deltaproteobacteria bacterium]